VTEVTSLGGDGQYIHDMQGRTFARRHFLRSSLALASLGLLSGCAALPIGPQRPARLPRVGYLSSGGGWQERTDGFRLGLQDHGYVEGQNIVVEWRNAEGRVERIPDLADELVRLSPDVIVAVAGPTIAAARAATGTIPIVMVGSIDPVEAGFVASLARPGGNITGVTTIGHELIGKRLQLFKETVPGLARVGVLWNPVVDDREREFQVAEAAARALGLEVRSLEVRDHGALEAAFGHASAERVDGLFLVDSPFLSANAPRIAEVARRHRLPTIAANRIQVTLGVLMAYGADRPAMDRRAAGYVDRILKGANPAEMPVERAERFEFVINLGTARDLGLTIPPSVLQQATEVIQ